MIHFNSSKILIPVDFSDTSVLAIKHGAFIAKLTKGDLYLLHVVNSHYMAQNMLLNCLNRLIFGIAKHIPGIQRFTDLLRFKALLLGQELEIFYIRQNQGYVLLGLF